MLPPFQKKDVEYGKLHYVNTEGKKKNQQWLHICFLKSS